MLNTYEICIFAGVDRFLLICITMYHNGGKGAMLNINVLHPM